jgi:hypothetical protein
LVEWARVAADSDEFAKKVALDYWRIFFGESPSATDTAEHEKLWRGLKNDNQYNVEKMLHALIETEAYGVP